MLTGRILVVGRRQELLEGLSPILRDAGHVTLTVPTAEEALSVLDEGIIPDVIITEEPDERAGANLPFLIRFRTLNQLGQHVVVAAEGPASVAPTRTSSATWKDDVFALVPDPADAEGIRGILSAAMEEIHRNLQSLRGEIFREADRLQQAIRAAQFEMVMALAVTMEAKDRYMRGHCARVAEGCERVAARMGIGEAARERLHHAALLHEIGKVGISLELLHKREELTGRELDQIRSHTSIGAGIIRAIPTLAGIAPIIEHVHTDVVDLPTALPDREEDQLCTAILRVVDAHDAMTSERAYQRVLSRERWEAVLREGAGSRFHAGVVFTFLNIERERLELE